MFKGDIAKFSPADLLTFLAHLGKEGVLAVSRPDESLSISFRDGRLVDAQSETTDNKVLGALYLRRLIDKETYGQISRARRETGLPLRQILENVESFDGDSATEVLETGIREVLFQLFLWESGQFQFAEIPVETGDRAEARDCERLTLDIAREVDEYRETVRNITSLDRAALLTAPGRGARDTSMAARYVLTQAEKRMSVRRIVDSAPFTSYETVKAVRLCLDEGWIELGRDGGGGEPPAGERAVAGELFFSCKRTLQKLFRAGEPRHKVREVVNFCKEHFDYILFIAAREHSVVRAMRFSRNPGGQLENYDIRNLRARIDADPTFKWVCESKHPFSGKVYPSRLLEEIGERPPGGECAIVPLGEVDKTDYLVYVASSRESEVPGPIHYLELLSWQINPPAAGEPEEPAAGAPETAPAPERTDSGTASGDGLKRMVEAVRELPPMPNVVTRILQLLSDPDSKMSDITEVLSSDQALVARLIKVSNSAFYGRGSTTSTLSQAVVRLGTKTLRSIVLTASTRSLFPSDETNTGLWAQALWQHSVECGLAARRVAELIGYEDPEEAFVGGVLHDIGKLVLLLNLPDEFRRARKMQSSEPRNSRDAERAVLGFDHTEVGELLLEKWQMPANLEACVRHHHHPHDAGDHAALACVVGYGDYLSHNLGAQPDEFQAAESVDLERTLAFLNLSEGALQVLEEEIVELFGHSDILD